MHLDIEQVLTQIVAFLIMLWVLSRYVWKPLLALLEERKNLIASEFDLIQLQKDELKAIGDDYQSKLKRIDAEAKTVINEAVKKGQQLAQDIEQETRQKAVTMLNKAQSEMQKEISLARNELKNEVVHLSIAATKKLIGETLDRNKHKELIKEAIDQIEIT